MARTVPVLVYHSVCDSPAPLMRDWAVTPPRFEEHLAFLTSEGYTTMTVTDYAACLRDPARAMPERLVVITFDDGFADFAQHAAPTLAAARMTATLYVSTAYVGETSSWLGSAGEQPMLTWSDIDDVAALGIEIGAHGHEHRALDELPGAKAQTNILESKNRLETHLGLPVESFAYPHGYHTRAIKEMVRLAGFTNACGVKHALSGPRDDVYALARVIVPPDADAARLHDLMVALPRASRHERMQTKAWRVVRRSRARRDAGTRTPAQHG
jgi:peptidoglycan/xylan/chitin deacetylase (PgdA/CDA1 family)